MSVEFKIVDGSVKSITYIDDRSLDKFASSGGRNPFTFWIGEDESGEKYVVKRYRNDKVFLIEKWARLYSAGMCEYMCFPIGHADSKTVLYKYYEGGDVMSWVTPKMREDVFATEAYQKMAVRIGVDSLNALKMLHEAGYAHGDIKPENLFLHKDWEKRMEEGKQVVVIGDCEDIFPLEKGDKYYSLTPEYCAPYRLIIFYCSHLRGFIERVNELDRSRGLTISKMVESNMEDCRAQYVMGNDLWSVMVMMVVLLTGKYFISDVRKDKLYFNHAVDCMYNIGLRCTKDMMYIKSISDDKGVVIDKVMIALAKMSFIYMMFDYAIGEWPGASFVKLLENVFEEGDVESGGAEGGGKMTKGEGEGKGEGEEDCGGRFFLCN